MPRIWKRSTNGGYYVTIKQSQIPLGRDRAGAEREYARLMGNGTPQIARVDDLFDRYLRWLKVNRAEGTYQRVEQYVRSFDATIPCSLRVYDLSPAQVLIWLDNQATWNTTTKHHAVRALKRAFNWAIEAGLIQASPISSLKAPRKKARELLVTQEMWKRIKTAAPDRCFQEMLVILQETGCRPFEARTVTGANVRDSRWVFTKEDSKGKKYNRVVYLTDMAVWITKRGMERYPTGPILRNSRGNPWTKDALVSRFRRLSERMGTTIRAGAFRHTFCTSALERNVDSTTLAVLMGHRDPSQIGRTYSHLTHNQEHLQRALAQATAYSKAPRQPAS